MTKTIGIDLGTTNTVCCTMENGRFNFINFSGRTLLPSVMMLKDGKLTIGEKARRRAILYSENYISSSKTFIADFSKQWIIEGKTLNATDVAAQILMHVYRQASQQIKTNQGLEAVITVPAYFTANQINETKLAGENAGFKIKQILTEPVAAAVAYGFEDGNEQSLAVIDIGGGTFDVSILRIDGREFNTVSLDGDRHLGGDAFSEALLELCLKKIRRTIGVNFANQESSGLSFEDFSRARQRLINECERGKIELSDVEAIELEIPNLFNYRDKPYHFSLSVTRQDFENECQPLIKKIQRIVKNCVHNSNMEPSDVNKVILVGGTAYMPAIKDFVTELFGKQPYADMDLAKLVAMGAALVADDERDGIQIRDIISHSLGIEVVGEKFSKILFKNTRYPVTEKEMYTTVEDYQAGVIINIFEGEDEKNVNNNSFYGTFDLEEIEKALANIPQIEVTFHFDKSRDLHVNAKDLNTGTKKSITVRIDKTGYNLKNTENSSI